MNLINEQQTTVQMKKTNQTTDLDFATAKTQHQRFKIGCRAAATTLKSKRDMETFAWRL